MRALRPSAQRLPIEDRDMLRRLALLPLSLILLSNAPVKESPAAGMLGKLAQLEGHWAGQLTWTGARQGTDKIEARYETARFKGTVFENLMIDGKAYMTSVYHLDGPDLRVTHFCVQNQPRLIADRIDPTGLSAHFRLVDVTNAGPKSGYVEEISLSSPAPDTMQIQFVFKGNAPRSVETINLKRVA
jgi:hypothetical protein